MTTHLGFVEDVIVNQGRGMDHFHDRREYGMLPREPTASLGRQKYQGRTEPLPAKVGTMLHQLLHERKPTAKLFLKDPFGLVKFGGDRPLPLGQSSAAFQPPRGFLAGINQSALLRRTARQ